jgi:hypothetical protein
VGCPPDPIDFYGLLISCRTIYTEAAALLYSANSFVVHHYAPAQLPGLQALGTLTEPSLRSLSQLKIVLREAACHNRVTENDYSESCCCQGRDDNSEYDWSDSQWCRQKHCNDIRQAPLLSDGCTTSAADDVRRTWHAAAAQLFARITPGRLALSLVSDIDPQHPLARRLAESILAPLFLLPRSYLSECRIRLAQTPDGGPLQQLAQDAAVHVCGLPTPVPHAAFSSHCTCWAPPGPTLFLVCRTLSQEARYVFFSRNRFIILDYQARQVWRLPDSPSEGNSYPLERFAASEFLSDVVPASALAHLRFLELVFPPYPSATCPGPEHPAARDWLAMVGWLREDRLNRPALTLRVVVDESNGAPDRAGEATPDEAAALLRAYAHLVRPLRGLGLARFYAHFRYPCQRSWADVPNEPPRPSPWFDPWLEKQNLKERLERYVMGARYEGLYSDSSKEPAPSDWDHMSFS